MPEQLLFSSSIVPGSYADTDNEAATAENYPELLSQDPVVNNAIKLIERAKNPIQKWREQSQESRRFESCKQFSLDDIQFLESQLRPHAVFNVAQKFIKLVSGIERRSREHVDFVPIDVTNNQAAFAGDYITKVYDWIMSHCHGDEERSRAFKDKLIDGMGWTETLLDTTRDPEGMISLSRVDGQEMLWDANARKTNNVDMRWCGRVRLLPYDEALLRWPDRKGILEMMKGFGRDNPEIIQVSLFNWLVAYSQFGGPQPQTDVLGATYAKHMVPVVDFQWQTLERGFLFFDPLDKTVDWLNEEDFKKYTSRLERLRLPQVTDKVAQVQPKFQRVMFTGRWRLSDPIHLPGKRFTYNCMTGSWDDEEKLWYGFLRLLMDPQRFANKFLNQTLEIMTHQSKAGLLAVPDAFVNPRQAEEQYAKVGSIQWMKEGFQDKVKDKPLPQIPAGSIEMFKMCIPMLGEVAGISSEALGMETGDAPVGTTQQRNAANIAMLADEFAALRLYRIEEAYTILDFIPFISDGRLVRLGDQTERQVVRLVKEPLTYQYEVLLEENDNDPRLKERYYKTIAELAPMLIRTNNFFPELLDYWPLPRRIIEMLKDGMKKNAENAMKMQQMGLGGKGRGAPPNPQEQQAKIEKMNAEAALARRKAEAIGGEGQMKQIKMIMDGMMQREKQAESRLKQKMMQVDMTKTILTGR